MSLLLGVVGAFLPVVPTTPFLLLAAACYARSSDRFYRGLMNNRILGSYIRNYREGRGMPLRAKATLIAFLWSAISFSILLAVSDTIIRITLIAIAIAVTFHIATTGSRRKEEL